MAFYLSHRLAVAGFTGGRLFKPGALKTLHGASGGFPRLINILVHKSLMLAYGEGCQQVTARHVREAARDTGASRNRNWVWRSAAKLAGIAATLGGAGWVYFR